MPMYNYECKECGYREKQFEKIDDRDKHICPKCGQKMERVFLSFPTVKYNSDGFYSTDYSLLTEDEKNGKT